MPKRPAGGSQTVADIALRATKGSGVAVTWGLDMSTDPSKTGLVRLDWDGSNPAVVTDYPRPKRSEIVEFIAESHGISADACWAVDVPFGWPTGFGSWLASHLQGPAPFTDRPRSALDLDARSWSHFARRETDRVVLELLGLKSAGFSVSFDKLGSTAAAWATIEAALAARANPIRVDRSGMDRFILETWPSAAWRQFTSGTALESRNPAKMRPDEFASALNGVVCLGPDAAAMSASDRGEHARDAVVCALVARAASMTATLAPRHDQLGVAKREGWIHLPTQTSLVDLVEGLNGVSLRKGSSDV